MTPCLHAMFCVRHDARGSNGQLKHVSTLDAPPSKLHVAWWSQVCPLPFLIQCSICILTLQVWPLNVNPHGWVWWFSIPLLTYAAKAAHFLHACGIFQSCLMPLTHPNFFEGSAQKIVISAQKNAGSINLCTAKLPDQNSKHRKTHAQHVRLLAQAQNRKQLTQHRINKLSTASCRLSTENCHLSTENCHLRTKKCWINQSQKSKLLDQNSKLLRKHSRQLAESEHSKPWNQAKQSKLHSQCSKLLAQSQHRKLLPQHSKLQAQHRKLSSQHRKHCLSTENCWINQSWHSKFPAENSKLLSKHNRQLAESEHRKLLNQDKHRQTCSQHSKPLDQAQHRKLLSHHSKKSSAQQVAGSAQKIVISAQKIVTAQKTAGLINLNTASSQLRMESCWQSTADS